MGHVRVKNDLKFKGNWPSCASPCSSGPEQHGGAGRVAGGCLCGGLPVPGGPELRARDVPGASGDRQEGRVATVKSGEGGREADGTGRRLGGGSKAILAFTPRGEAGEGSGDGALDMHREAAVGWAASSEALAGSQ